MAGEVTVICMDTSSWMQNNRSPRFLAQAAAIELYCKEKIDFHPENCVGILAMGYEVYKLVEPTRDLQKIMCSIHGARVDNDSMSILDALESANQFLGNNMMYKRIVVFAGGPVYWFKHDLKKIGMKLKEKGVAVDVVNFGDKNGPEVGRHPMCRDPLEENSIPGKSKKGSLEALVTAANHMDNSLILHVPEDQFSLRDHLSRSPILSRRRWEQSTYSQYINARQKWQIDVLTKENENLKRELEFFRTEFSKFFQKVQGRASLNC